MRTETVNIYTFEELSDKAKEKAREWYRSLVFTDNNDWDRIYDDADTVAKMMGIDIDRKSVPLMNGKSRQEPCIWFSGFSSQGDGACFEGTYQFKKGAVRAVEAYAPHDSELSRIVRGLYRLQRLNFYQLTATCKHRGHYYHSGCMAVDVERSDRGTSIDAEHELRDLLRSFADWIYKQLEQEYEHQMSDETVDANIISGEHEFYENGERV